MLDFKCYKHFNCLETCACNVPTAGKHDTSSSWLTCVDQVERRMRLTGIPLLKPVIKILTHTHFHMKCAKTLRISDLYRDTLR
jgi:hypothetical protein